MIEAVVLFEERHKVFEERHEELITVASNAKGRCRGQWHHEGLAQGRTWP